MHNMIKCSNRYSTVQYSAEQYAVQYTAFSMQRTVQCTVFSIQYTLSSKVLNSIQHNIQCSTYSAVYSIVYSMHYTVQCTHLAIQYGKAYSTYSSGEYTVQYIIYITVHCTVLQCILYYRLDRCTDTTILYTVQTSTDYSTVSNAVQYSKQNSIHDLVYSAQRTVQLRVQHKL